MWVGSGQAGRSWVRLPVRFLSFFFHSFNPYGRTLAVGLTLPLRKGSKRGIHEGKGSRCVGLANFPTSCVYCLEVLGASNSCIPKGLPRSVMRYTGILVYWYTGILVHWYTGTLVHWYTGTLVYWYTGILVHWYTGILVHWYTGILVYWYTSTLVHWYTGILVHWYTGILVHWYTGILVY